MGAVGQAQYYRIGVVGQVTDQPLPHDNTVLGGWGAVCDLPRLTQPTFIHRSLMEHFATHATPPKERGGLS